MTSQSLQGFVRSLQPYLEDHLKSHSTLKIFKEFEGYLKILKSFLKKHHKKLKNFIPGSPKTLQSIFKTFKNLKEFEGFLKNLKISFRGCIAL